VNTNVIVVAGGGGGGGGDDKVVHEKLTELGIKQEEVLDHVKDM